MSDFATSFLRPMTAPFAVAGFMLAGDVRPVLVAAACVGLYLALLEIGRQGGWK